MDVYEDNEAITFLLDSEDLTKISKIKPLLSILVQRIGKRVEIVFFSENLEKFVRNLFWPAKIKKVLIKNAGKGKIVVAVVDFWEKGKALGRHSYKLYRARYFIKKYFPQIQTVYIQG